MLDFYFMSIGTEFVGDNIRDTPINEPQQEGWTQMPLELEGSKRTPSSPLKVTIVDKVSANPLPPSTKEEHVQKE